MREIKFRAWDKKNKKMLDVDGINFNEFGFQQFKSAGIACELPDSDGLNQILRLSEVELMQYTGLKDKNGKDIWEGDIVNQKDLGIVVVIFINGAFCVKGETVYFTGKLVFEECEVLGNIYESPELLEVQA